MQSFRTTHCNSIRQTDIGKEVTLAGWVDTIRNHGGVIFIDLRDQEGMTQVVLHDETKIHGIHKESVISVTGKVVMRDEETVNRKIDTGTVEVHSDSITLLSSCSASLPFEPARSRETREELRLKYRFLDLRNPLVHKDMVLRSKVISHLRHQMEEMGFLEMQTPILTMSSPEGARDYLVPSRKHRGKFYALPQAPQQFKQLLMASGFDRYFQIAPCFRDEDARLDRSPGEFYQLDFEMAFADQEDVFEVAESVLYSTFSRFSDKEVSKPPFRRISFEESMLRYGTDKPDLRNPLLIDDLTDFFLNVDFAPFKGKPVRGIKANCSGMSRSFFENMFDYAVAIGMKGLGYLTLSDGSFKGPIDKFLSDEKKAELIEMCDLKDGDTVYFISDKKTKVDRFSGQIRTKLCTELGLLQEDKFEMCFIVDFPMYETNEETGKIDFTHNPFSMPQGGMDALKYDDPLTIKAWQYDIVCNGIELSSGAVRNHRPDIMKEAFSIAGYSEDVLKEKFGALYTAFSYGAPPHAGMAPGVDRIVMMLAGHENIREVIAFPLNSNGQDLLLGAPGEVTEKQLKEVHIKMR
ncbi:aspartate--tRNA ligase [Youngiibacter multivorans]|uniref:Aspartate--tRNA(Asp/Asn) ligase n=1 Tax=Youngiibacter multivorans TaxID=937251 RepID=A0ABS4G7K3_9CLOT|nr:aspartate--tRNA ligase [Youngiibacter multivorans]MBP1920514.1 aspartyl-tRNA synthetase [Youngiibacter multivorans]